MKSNNKNLSKAQTNIKKAQKAVENQLFIEKDKNVMVKKHSAIIQMKNDITANQRKLFNAILYLAGKQIMIDPKIQEFKARFSEVKKFAGLANETNSKYIKSNLKTLQETAVEYNILNKDKEEEWGQFSLLSEVKIKHEDEFIYFAFPPTIMHNIKMPSVYALLNIGIISSLRSKYSIAIYELLQDYKKIGKIKLNLYTFKKLAGILDGQYDIFTTFKSKVLDVAINEINDKTDLRVSYTLEKEGRRYNSVEFKIHTIISPAVAPVMQEMMNNTHSIDYTAYEEVEAKVEEKVMNKLDKSDNSIVRKLIYYGISEKNANKYLDKLPEDDVQEAIKILENTLKNKSVKNPGGYLASLLSNDNLFGASLFAKENEEHEIVKKEEQQKNNEKAALLRMISDDFNGIYNFVKQGIASKATDDDFKEYADSIVINEISKMWFIKEGIINEAGELNREVCGRTVLFQSFLMEKYYPRDSEFIKFAKMQGFVVVKNGDKFEIMNIETTM